ncbi:hypothetical protein [Lactobacillus ultunensis]|uniref:Uncharacterized protein n=1 Tax=Lactobacillus ultunensis DSM 16047 TaxID=525365 RepID=C2EK61_9LACO|nr:hypothetical protein [Lactobacillus ultunensis]EEJ73076.1 hypothetical protein HMPREF0548_0057 [Lactobacillus ultunensis DSM 16047]KRL82655.1 hypothetical protein FC57_GL001429 [Lactobacillus ultunensis DSM 16047]QQP29406.1 hypothetical protein H4B44_04960 [Lactobacillus ultunensis]
MNDLTSFGNLFKQMWLQKRRYIYLLFFINLFTIIFVSLFALATQNYNLLFFESPNKSLVDFWRYNSANLTIYFDLAFGVITCWQNEKINMSQTWHLAAADEGKTYLANVFSSLIACGFFFLLQQIVNTLLLIPTMGADCVAEAFSQFGLSPITPNITGINIAFEFYWFFVVLVILFIYFFVSFTNFASRIVSEELPMKSTLWIRLLIIAILVIIAVYVGSIVFTHLQNLIDTNKSLQTYDPIWLDDILLLLVDLIFGLCDILFVKKWVEPKIVNR